MMQAIATLDPQDLTEYLAKVKLLESNIITVEEYKEHYCRLAEKYKFDPKRAYITFKHGVVFVEVPDSVLN